MGLTATSFSHFKPTLLVTSLIVFLATSLWAYKATGQSIIEAQERVQESELRESFFVECSGEGSTCAEVFAKTVETQSTLAFRYQVPATGAKQQHCSAITLRVLVDGQGRFSRRMGWPGQANSGSLDTGRIDLGPVSPGRHHLEFQAVGHAGPCQRDGLTGWGGTMTTFTSVTAGSPLVSRRLNTAPGSPVIGTLHAAPVSGGELLILFASGNRREGLGVAHFPGVLPPRIPWQRLTLQGANISTFAASLNGGTMVAVVDDGNRRQGRDLAFVPVPALNAINWQPLPFSGLATPTRVFQARISSGSNSGTLVLLDSYGNGKKSMALAFVPGGLINSLHFVPVASNLNPNRFVRAAVPGGTLLGSAREGAGLLGGGLDFIPGSPPSRLNFRRIFNQGTTATLDSFDTVVGGKRLIYVTDQGNQRRAEDLVLIP